MMPEKQRQSKLDKAQIYHENYLLKSSKQDLEDAIKAYIDAIGENPEEASAYYRLAVLMYENKQINLDSAIEQCRRAISLDDKNPDARMYLGYFLSLKGDKKEAKKELQTAVNLSPKGKNRAKFVMALELFEKEKTFREFFKGFSYIFQAFFIGFFNKAAIKMLGEKAGGRINFYKCLLAGEILENLKMDKKAYRIYSSALNNVKTAPVFYEKMAKIALRKNRIKIALKCYKNASKLSGNAPDKLINIIDFLQEKYPEKIDEMIDYYNLLIMKMPEFSRPYYELGHLYLKKQNWLSAASAFKLALKNDKKNPFYMNSLAFSYVQLEQYSSAVKLYKRAIEINPDNEWTAVVAQALAAIFYKIENDYEAAIATLEYALTLTKDKGSIYTLFGDIYFDGGSMDMAINYYNKAIENNIKDTKIYTRLAMAYWEKDFAKEAVDCYLSAIENDPSYAYARNNLGVIYLDSLKDYDKALNCLTQAVEIDPSYMLAHFNLGRCYALLNRQIDAACEFHRAIELNRETSELDEEFIQGKIYELFET